MDVTSKYRILIGISVVALVAAILAPRIAQDPLYHQFADQNTFLSIPNALNVLTNLLFAWIGIEGLYRLLCRNLCVLLKMCIQPTCVFLRP